jgi:hypothetical protein
VDDRHKDTQGEITKRMRGIDGISSAGTLQSMHGRGKEYRDSTKYANLEPSVPRSQS